MKTSSLTNLCLESVFRAAGPQHAGVASLDLKGALVHVRGDAETRVAQLNRRYGVRPERVGGGRGCEQGRTAYSHQARDGAEM